VIDPIGYAAVPDGTWHIMHDCEDNDWALWWKEAHAHDHLHVDWGGRARIPSVRNTEGWEPDVAERMRCYVIDEQRADQCVMAATAFTTPEQWYAFARRMVERETCPTT